MNKSIVLAIAVGAVSLAACGNKTDANEKNFGAALTQSFDKYGELCLTTAWPKDLAVSDSLLQNMQVQDAQKMAALEAVGLAKSEAAEKMGASFGRGMVAFKVKRYTLTDAAKPFAREVPSNNPFSNDSQKSVNLCWGQKTLDKVVKWVGPMKLGDYQEAVVTYTYKIDKVAEWANNPAVQAAFKELKTTIDGVGTKEDTKKVSLTSLGWEAAKPMRF